MQDAKATEARFLNCVKIPVKNCQGLESIDKSKSSPRIASPLRSPCRTFRLATNWNPQVMSRKKTMQQPHYANTQDARVIQSRQSLQQALLDLLEDKSFKDITIKEITEAAGLGYNTFFRHYADKDALLKDIADGEIKHLIELSVAALDGINTKEAARAICGYVAAHRALWTKLVTAGAVEALREEFIRLSWIEAEKTTVARSLPAEVGIIMVASGTIELLAWWLRKNNPITVEELTTIYEELVVSPTIRIYNK